MELSQEIIDFGNDEELANNNIDYLSEIALNKYIDPN